MRKLCMMAIGAALLISGCRTPSEQYQAEPQSAVAFPEPFDKENGVTPDFDTAEDANRHAGRDAAGPSYGESEPYYRNPIEAPPPTVNAQATHTLAFAQQPLERTPPIEHRGNPDRIVRRASYEIQPSQGPAELVVPEPLELPVPETTDGLTLFDLEQMALAQNPALAQAAARVEAAQGNWVQVGLPPNVVFGYSGQQLGSGGQAEQQGVFIGQEFVTGKKLRLNREVAAWEVQRAEQELATFQLRVLTDVRIGYYDVLITQRRRKLAADLVNLAEQGELAAQALFKAEEVSEADPLRARIEAETARILLQTSINQHFEAWRRLTAVLGVPDLALQQLAGDLNADDLQFTWQDALQQVLRESPELAAATAEVEAARFAIERAHAEVVPNIEVQGVVQGDRGTNSTNGNLQVTMPLPLWNRNQGGVQRAYAEAAAAERAVDRLAMDIQSRLAVAFQRYESARNQVEKYSKKGGILDNAQRSLDLIRTGYKADEFSVLDLLNAQRIYFQTNLDYLDAQRELWVSVMEIRGLLLRGSLPK